MERHAGDIVDPSDLWILPADLLTLTSHVSLAQHKDAPGVLTAAKANGVIPTAMVRGICTDASSATTARTGANDRLRRPQRESKPRNNRHGLRMRTAPLRRASRRVARRKKGSNRRRKAVKLLAKVHQQVVNQRKDFHHKAALTLVRRFGLIAHEDLNVRGIARTRLAKSTHDAGWATFLTILAHKAESAGVTLIAVDPRHTSQACSTCGARPEVPKTLAERVHTCPCGLVLDRDENAARNILQRALGRSVQAVTLSMGSVA